MQLSHCYLSKSKHQQSCDVFRMYYSCIAMFLSAFWLRPTAIDNCLTAVSRCSYRITFGNWNVNMLHLWNVYCICQSFVIGLVDFKAVNSKCPVLDELDEPHLSLTGVWQLVPRCWHLSTCLTSTHWPCTVSSYFIALPLFHRSVGVIYCSV